MTGPLSHLRVLDLSRILAGPWAAQILADLGADVTKVELPGVGDDSRSWGPPFLKDEFGEPTRDAGYFLAVNRGKRSITLNIATPEGADVVRKLAADVDIVIENYRVGTLAKYGLSHAQLAEINPRLVYCSVTGFGQNGPRAKQPAYDFLIQAMGGLMSVTGAPDHEPGGGPQKVGIPIIDLITGVYASSAILAGIAARDATGKGQYIDMAMLDVQVNLLSNQAMNHLLTGRVPQRTGNAHPNIQPQKVYRCRDGDIILVVGNDAQFERLCEAMGVPALSADDRFRTNAFRVANRAALEAELDPLFTTDDRAVWLQRIEAMNVPCGPINSIPEALTDPQVAYRGMVRRLPHPVAGSVPQIASPFRFNDVSLAADRAPPMLGQHTDEILSELGFPRSTVEQWRERGIV
ncbi:CaiB/BaiF CoA-transferase family protein [soil metagenome]